MLEEFVEHYNKERPHGGLAPATPTEERRVVQGGAERVGCRRRLGGLLREYYMVAA